MPWRPKIKNRTKQKMETCKNLLKLLPSSSPHSSPSTLNTFSSFLFILKENKALILSPGVLNVFLFICQSFPLSYVTAAWIQIPQLKDKLLWGQGLYLIHLCVSSVTWLRIGTHKMSVKWIGESPDTWIRLPQKCLWPKSEWRVSEVTY